MAKEAGTLGPLSQTWIQVTHYYIRKVAICEELSRSVNDELDDRAGVVAHYSSSHVLESAFHDLHC
eukprot:scaffold170198_cov19-Prasinocladus_malaysianus.AAC.1